MPLSIHTWALWADILWDGRAVMSPNHLSCTHTMAAHTGQSPSARFYGKTEAKRKGSLEAAPWPRSAFLRAWGGRHREAKDSALLSSRDAGLLEPPERLGKAPQWGSPDNGVVGL